MITHKKNGVCPIPLASKVVICFQFFDTNLVLSHLPFAYAPHGSRLWKE
ncbi:MAG: hypothetical protein M3139_10710 [Bacteroidota bacterium]|nr:hypothetical protein [Bacteroidota bacterium]